MKVVCEKCESSFKFEAVKDMKCCPVCGELFDLEEEENTDNGNDLQENNLMYFDEIATKYKERPEYNGVCAYCGECKGSNHLAFEKIDKIVDKKYVILKDGIAVKCKSCGKEHTARKILYKKKEHYAPPLPRCPACNSVMLKKITKGSKIMAAATLGTFALPYNSKTFECKDCGYRF